MRALRYGDDEHYDIVSAFIKSIRGSDVDAGLYWLARMLEAGEDARYIARRGGKHNMAVRETDLFTCRCYGGARS
jgi:replication-associated recombination protein RarA